MCALLLTLPVHPGLPPPLRLQVKLQHESLVSGVQHGEYRRQQTPAAEKAFAFYKS